MSYSEEKLLIAVQGTKGAYGQLAAEKMFPNGTFIYFKYFDAVAKAVRSGMCRYGVLPIENNTYGSVKPVYKLLHTQEISIVHSLKLEIQHRLLAKPGTAPGDIRKIISHEQAIGQCSEFLHSLGDNVQVSPVMNTAVAARMVSESDNRTLAAISSPECAAIYGLEVIKKKVADSDHNYTRFLCIAASGELSEASSRISLILSLPHVPGSLTKVLSRFSDAGINLLKIESTPIPGKDFEFLFYIDFAASVNDETTQKILGELRLECPSFTFLGCYSEET